MANPAQPTPPPDFKPHVFGKFFLLQRLAIGGMAEIFRAKVSGAEGFEKEMVVKRILPARAQDQNFIKMLVNEAKLTVQLTHNNIAQVYECGTIDGNYFISMELVNGVSLKDMMVSFARAGAPVTPEQAIFVVLQLLQGLEYAHRRTDSQGKPLRIVHCDVSPDNALVSWQGELKLLDFGIARAATGLSNYKEGMLMGKLGYVAPEQASTDRGWDHRVDVFAAGIILYELLTKQKPFPRAVDVDSLVQSRKAKVAPPSSIDARLPKELDAIVLKALAADPDERYADARSFADALVDQLFPTPHSAIQDHLGRQMHQVYGERIEKQRAARAHDALVMKVLRNVAEQQRAAVYDSMARAEPASATSGAPAPAGSGSGLELAGSPARLDPDADRARPPGPAPERLRTVRVGGARAVLLGVLAGLGVAVAGFAAAPWLRDGVLVVATTPPGAQVTVDGKPVAGVTPLVVEGVRLSSAHRVEAALPGHRTGSATTAAEAGRLSRTVHITLASATGTFVVESQPPGAEIRVDGEPRGRTPATITGLRVDERHRVDLVMPGYELDQFVVLPEKDGDRFLRRLVPRR